MTPDNLAADHRGEVNARITATFDALVAQMQKPGDHLRRAPWPTRQGSPERIDPATGEVLDPPS